MSDETKAMKIIKPAAEPSNEGPAEYFTGTVRVTLLVKGETPSCLTCASVGFQPGARSAWHTHPKGQLLIVTAGSGLIQEWGKPVRRIVTGDVIWTPPDVKHWHGAAPESAKGRYSPAKCTGIKKTAKIGDPDEKLVSTSYAERQNLTMRMHMRRFTRLTNAFSKKFESHCHMVALYTV